MKARMIVLGVMGVILLLLILSMFTGPDRINWSESFAKSDKNPYGAYILYELLPDLFPESEISPNKEESYYTFEDKYYQNTAYILLTNEYRADVYDIEAMLSFVADSNYAFLIARNMPNTLLDTFGIEITSPVLEFLADEIPKADSNNVRFANPALKKYRGFDFIRASEEWFFQLSRAGENLSVLAYNQFDQPCLIKIKHGAGFLILGTSPRMFSNYFLLHRDDHRFAEGALSHIPSDADILWDQFYKGGNFSYNNRSEQEDPDLLAYISSQRSLNWAYWIVAFAVLVYVIFESKRKQRVIPEHKPLPNATLEFTETVGRLYYQSHDHKNVAEKKIKILLAYIRTQYFLKTSDFSPEFIEILSGKSGMNDNEIRILCRMIERIRKREQITESELLELNLLVESFYLHANGRH